MKFSFDSPLNLTVCFIFIFGLLFAGCGKNDLKEKGDPSYINSIKQWRETRAANLKKENGWLNLTGLFWLSEGENSFGSDPSNKIIFPKEDAPAFIGSFNLKDGIVSAKIYKGVNVTLNGKPVLETNLISDTADNPTVLAFNSLRWFLIKRGDKFGIRLRNLNAPLVKKFKGIDSYPINDDWRIKASYELYDPPKIISVPSIIGTVDEDTVPGALAFQLNGKEYKLDPIEEGNQFFIIFADETNGDETYGAGRFLYTSKPDSAGEVILDFNKAYNPPCAFTKYATCPLPPEQNYLHLKITAGEKVYGTGHH